MKVVVIEIKIYQQKNTQIIHKSDTWKIQFTIAINFISSKDVDEENIMHSKSDNIEFMLYDNANEVVNEHFG